MIDIWDACHKFGGLPRTACHFVSDAGLMFDEIRIFGVHFGEVFTDDDIRSANITDTAMLEPHHPVADCLYVAHGMTDKDDRDSTLPQLMNLAEPSLPEVNVA